MKKMLVIAALAITAGFVCYSQTKKDAPAAVKEAFAKQYPGITAKWDKEGDKYEASFKKDGHDMSTVYTAAGQLEETEVDITIDELPAPVKAYVQKNYKNASIKEAAKITKANGDVNFEAEVKGKDLLFDSKGNFLKVAEED